MAARSASWVWREIARVPASLRKDDASGASFVRRVETADGAWHHAVAAARLRFLRADAQGKGLVPMQGLMRRMLAGCGLAATAFVSGSAVDPGLAGAHCGDHAGNCGNGYYLNTTWCEGTLKVYLWDVYVRWCSGTCYNGNMGCCTSPDSCWNDPCKPGGCGPDCAYVYSQESYEPNGCL